MKRLRWRVGYTGALILHRGHRSLASVYRRADGWHASVGDAWNGIRHVRSSGATYGWIDGISGVFRTRAAAMRATVKLVRAL